ncbi:FkbM family methyltransferase [Breoghania sp. L-A4]|uniref:FkbM family methyltransferase n=1 Tax=Breoghania sp. L-A4 TaxID=2304600 RepID=UPI000E35E970|nr:FkbM family methyltransferase [Breoghania sp. L-A4]AXS38990.1 FkbM family methyltransferase [Breoghania sp. L-A4]
MNTVETIAEPYGAYRLGRALEGIRRVGNRLPDTFAGRRLASVIRKLCLRCGGAGPFDIPLFERQHARVYPRTNRCEKRAFSGMRSWDRAERAFLRGEIETAPAGRPFVFVDAGANVGFYSLFVTDAAACLDRATTVLAIEPDAVNRGRLSFNISASQAEIIAVCPDALGGAERFAVLVDGESNRGEVRLCGAARPAAADGVVRRVRVRLLGDILTQAGISRIDVLKMDIEGEEFETLQAFFAKSPFALWPGHIVLEVGRSGTSKAFELCRANGYMPAMSARINSILRRPASPPATLDA